MKYILMSICLAGSLSAQSLNPSFTAATTSGSVPKAMAEVTFISSSTYTGTVGGAAFPASQTLKLGNTVGNTNNMLPSISYTVTAGTLYIYATRRQ